MAEDIDKVFRIRDLCKDRDLNYQLLQEEAISLVGTRLLFKRGKKQAVLCDVLKFCEHSLCVIIRNISTLREYEMDISKVKIIKIVVDF